MKSFIIYGLVDPRTGQLRYIGKSSSGMKRPRRHFYEDARLLPHLHVSRWIRQLQSQGLTYQIVVFQELPDAEGLSEAEIGWIAYFRKVGCPLTNLTDGGDGMSGFRHTDATRAKMSEAAKNRGEAYALNMSKVQMGHIVSPETARKISLSKKALSDESRRNISNAQKGKKRSLESREKQSAAWRRKREEAGA